MFSQFVSGFYISDNILKASQNFKFFNQTLCVDVKFMSPQRLDYEGTKQP